MTQNKTKVPSKGVQRVMDDALFWLKEGKREERKKRE